MSVDVKGKLYSKWGLPTERDSTDVFIRRYTTWVEIPGAKATSALNHPGL
jgi:hypothetical protein